MSKHSILEFDFDDSVLDEFEENATAALWMTAEATHTDLIQSQTIPFKTGHLQKETSVYPKRKGSKEYRILSKTEYAHRLHEHPEYNFNKEENPQAGGEWLTPYVDGEKAEMILNYFLKFAKKRM